MSYQENNLDRKELPLPLILNEPSLIFKTSQQWKILFLILSALSLIIVFLTAITIKIPLLFLMLIFIIMLIGFVTTYITVTSRVLYFEDDRVVYSTMSNKLHIPLKQVRSFYVTDNMEGFGTIFINGGDTHSRIRFWAISDHNAAEEAFILQLSENN